MADKNCGGGLKLDLIGVNRQHGQDKKREKLGLIGFVFGAGGLKLGLIGFEIGFDWL